MSRTAPSRKYGKKSTRSKAERLFAELAQSPVRRPDGEPVEDDGIGAVTEKLSFIDIADDEKPTRRSEKSRKPRGASIKDDLEPRPLSPTRDNKVKDERESSSPLIGSSRSAIAAEGTTETQPQSLAETSASEPLRVLTWDDVCPPGDQIIKIAEASYAEVYRVTNERGTSIIKVIRLESPIRAQTKAQIQAGLVDEEPHSEEDIQGELQISEWLADIPGFVVYKERYLVQGKATRALLETHQKFQRRMKRQDPGRAQFYPSPSRYLDGTKFLVVELGDAGTALEDWPLKTESQLWDIFFLEAIALARAEDIAMFEVCMLLRMAYTWHVDD